MNNGAAMVGKKFGMLTVISLASEKGGFVHVICDCGVSRIYPSRNVRYGTLASCGCRLKTHGDSNSHEYNAWRSMWKRCVNPRHRFFKHYGGRNITVCDRWKNYAMFLADMGRRPTSAHSLDRIDNNAGYSPENCRWATQKQQAENRRCNKWVEYLGERMLVPQWASRLGIKESTIYWRLRHGRSVEEALKIG